MKEHSYLCPAEEQLVELFQMHLIGWVQYVELHSEEMKEDYFEFCKSYGLNRAQELSAQKYLEHIENLL
jgi:hypothetical protein